MCGFTRKKIRRHMIKSPHRSRNFPPPYNQRPISPSVIIKIILSVSTGSENSANINPLNVNFEDIFSPERPV